jgi:hypothetical protein
LARPCAALLALSGALFLSSTQLRADSAGTLSTSATFECLWWSQAQMDGLDPNHPPPKETRVALTRWEYSDPVGVPHPDVVDLVVQIKNTSGDAVSEVSPAVQIQWLEGPLAKKQAAAWSPLTALPAQEAASIPAQQTRAFRYPIDVSDKMAQLAKQHGWPWSMRAVVTTRVAGTAAGSARFELPIIPGD